MVPPLKLLGFIRSEPRCRDLPSSQLLDIACKVSAQTLTAESPWPRRQALDDQGIEERRINELVKHLRRLR